MPAPKITRFTAYEFNESEYAQATILAPLQKQWIQTSISIIAEQILNLDCANKADLADTEIQRSYLKGQLDCLEHIIQLSEASELSIQEGAAAVEAEGRYILDRNISADDRNTNAYSMFVDQETLNNPKKSEV